MHENIRFRKRVDNFRWHSKQELYAYCQDTLGLKECHVDKEIKSVLNDFKLRKHKPINIEELWQKVGLHIEKKFLS